MIAGIIAFFTTVSTLISTPLAYYFYWKSKRIKTISYSSRSITVIDAIPNDNRLELIFSEKKLKRLVLTKLVIWNSGNETINLIDFYVSNPFVISFKDPETILETYLIYEEDKIDGFALNKNNMGDIQINFNRIDPGQGFLVQIMHEGSAEEWISVKGCIANKRRNKIVEVSHTNLGENIKNKGVYKDMEFVILLSTTLFYWVTIIALFSAFLIAAYMVLARLPGGDLVVHIGRLLTNPESVSSLQDLLLALPFSMIFLIAFPLSMGLASKYARQTMLKIERMFFKVKRKGEPYAIELLLADNWTISESNIIEWD